jgi:hypothetical protein
MARVPARRYIFIGRGSRDLRGFHRLISALKNGGSLLSGTLPLKIARDNRGNVMRYPVSRFVTTSRRRRNGNFAEHNAGITNASARTRPPIYFCPATLS